MEIPLPSEPEEGYILNSMKHANALTKQNIENQYLPLTSMSDAASKLTYARLMGPQFLAKLMGNEGVVANLEPEQQKSAPKLLYNAATGGPSSNNSLLNLPQRQSPLLSFVNSILGINQQQPNQPLQQNPNAVSQPNLAQVNRPNIRNAPSPNAYTAPGENPDRGMSYDAYGNNIVGTPPGPGGNTYPENVGTYKGIIEEGKELGTQRGKDIGEYGNKYEAALTRGDAYGQLFNIANSPTFKSMRSKIPYFQDLQMKVLKGIGPPEQQQMIGNFITSSQEIVRDTINSFQGQKMKGEITIAQNMKISDNDTFDVMVGKLKAGTLYNELGKQRSALVPEIMKSQHIDKRKALEIADKQIDGNKIRSQIDDLIKIQIKNKKTGKTEMVSTSEARKRGVPGV